MNLPGEDRKRYPMARGLLDLFPLALAEVSRNTQVGSEQHGLDGLGWDRDKSGDHADAIVRHLTDRGTLDKDGVPHSAKIAWRALAMLQEELEQPCEHSLTITSWQTKEGHCLVCGEIVPDDEPNAAYLRGREQR